MQYFFRGFAQTDNNRRYRFEGVGAGHVSRQFSVSVDVSLVTKHHIPIQDLPRLCLDLLEAQGEGTAAAGDLVCDEQHMLDHLDAVRAKVEARQKRMARWKRPFPPRQKQ